MNQIIDMTPILNMDECVISQSAIKSTIYTITFLKNNKNIINYVVKTTILMGATAYDNYYSCSFKATSVCSFKQFQMYLKEKNGDITLPYDFTLRLISNLSSQLKYLVTSCNVTFVGYDLDNIIVIDYNKFIYVNQLINITDNLITLTCPFTKYDFFMSPELIRVDSLPCKIDYRSIYYSFACLIIYCITCQLYNSSQIIDTYCVYDYFKIYKYSEDTTNIDNLPIKGTKLFGLLKRCLEKDVNYRCILFV